MKNFILAFTLFTTSIYAATCNIPKNIKKYIIASGANSFKNYPDIARNYSKINGLCISMLKFKEGHFTWKLFLVTNPNNNSGLFWFLPHDNENSAFDSAVYVTRKYGGGFLAVSNNDMRYNSGQDPNRNFSYSRKKVISCKQQKSASPLYTSLIFSIINYYKSTSIPYLALHNNTNGGGVSILKQSRKVKSYLAYPVSAINSDSALKDEDNLIYMAGLSKQPPAFINTLLSNGVNIKYEVVNKNNNDCSMSNFIVLEKGSDNYFNIEAEHHNSFIQKKMITILINSLKK